MCTSLQERVSAIETLLDGKFPVNDEDGRKFSAVLIVMLQRYYRSLSDYATDVTGLVIAWIDYTWGQIVFI